MAAAEPAAQAERSGAELSGPVAGNAPVSLCRCRSPPRVPTPSESEPARGRAAPTAGSAGRGPGAAPASPCGATPPAEPRSRRGPRAPPRGKSAGLAHLRVGVGRGLRSGDHAGEGGSGQPPSATQGRVPGLGGGGPRCALPGMTVGRGLSLGKPGKWGRNPRIWSTLLTLWAHLGPWSSTTALLRMAFLGSA